MKKECSKKGKAPPEKPEVGTLEKEFDELIDRERTKGSIVAKLFNQTVQSIGKIMELKNEVRTDTNK